MKYKDPVVCEMCKTPFWPKARRIGTPRQARFCSRGCCEKHKARRPEFRRFLKKIALLGRRSWTKENVESFKEKMRGENNPAWKGGVTYFKKKGNYKNVKYVRCPAAFMSMARKDGYVMEHRLVVAKILGRPLLRREVVHHDNHDPSDNRLKNLMLFASNREHKLFEARGNPLPIWSGAA